MSLLVLKEYQDSRVVIVGALEGSYYTLIDFLYMQEFSYKDILILTGNFINVDNPNSEKLINFIRESANVFSIKGANEKIFLDAVESKKHQICHFNLTQEDIYFLENLPLIIELHDNIYIVNAGYNPTINLDKQNPDYTIYKTNVVADNDWYNQEQQGSIFCFTHSKLDKTKLPGGYNLGNIDNNLHALILYKDSEPILIKI